VTEMHCEEFVELVTAFLDGALDPDDQARVVEHLDLCDGCSRYLDQVGVTISALGTLLPAENPLDREVAAALLNAFQTRAVDGNDGLV
jgi:predicted anti-sigma-YlaC factor YlaD